MAAGKNRLGSSPASQEIRKLPFREIFGKRPVPHPLQSAPGRISSGSTDELSVAESWRVTAQGLVADLHVTKDRVSRAWKSPPVMGR